MENFCITNKFDFKIYQIEMVLYTIYYTIIIPKCKGNRTFSFTYFEIMEESYEKK